MASQNHHVLQEDIAVVMVPFPAQGHLNQLLHLSRLITSHKIPVHYVGSATHIRQAKSRVQGWNPNNTENFHFHEFIIPQFASPLPDPNSKIKFPVHLQPCFDSSLLLREPLVEFLNSITSKYRRVVVIFDSAMLFVGEDVASISNGESYAFPSCSAFSICKFTEAFRELAQRAGNLCNSKLDGCFTSEFLRFMGAQSSFQKLYSGYICNTSRIIDGPYLDILGRDEGKKIWAIGPFNRVKVSKNETSNGDGHFCLNWLDKQERKSVIYVSFGSSTSLVDEQIKELAHGLEKSNQKFIWVLRYADTGDIFTVEKGIPELPNGFEERVKDKGIIVREWAPQLAILSHSSIGGFISHCGWNSCMESITNGVPILAWPMHSDQPMNTELITKVLNIGIVVREWTKRDEIVGSETIENVLKKLMASQEGDEIRKKAEEFGEAVRGSIAEGGVSRQELDSFIAHITR